MFRSGVAPASSACPRPYRKVLPAVPQVRAVDRAPSCERRPPAGISGGGSRKKKSVSTPVTRFSRSRGRGRDVPADRQRVVVRSVEPYPPNGGLLSVSASRTGVSHRGCAAAIHRYRPNAAGDTCRAGAPTSTVPSPVSASTKHSRTRRWPEHGSSSRRSTSSPPEVATPPAANPLVRAPRSIRFRGARCGRSTAGRFGDAHRARVRRPLRGVSSPTMTRQASPSSASAADATRCWPANARRAGGHRPISLADGVAEAVTAVAPHRAAQEHA